MGFGLLVTEDATATDNDYLALTLLHCGLPTAALTFVQFTAFLSTLGRHGGVLLLTRDETGSPQGSLTVHVGDRTHDSAGAVFRDLTLSPQTEACLVTEELLQSGMERARALGCSDVMWAGPGRLAGDVRVLAALRAYGFVPPAETLLWTAL
jgi:hypothetical protein